MCKQNKIVFFTDGFFSWNPSNVNTVRLGIQASDGTANGVLEPTVKVCDCQNNGTCLYNNYVENTNIMKNKFAVRELFHLISSR